MAVQVLASAVMTHRRARVGVAGGDLHVAQVNGSVETGCDVWRSMCGCALAIWMPAASARWRRRRVAACRSIRVPRLLSRTGPCMRDPVAWSMARPAAGGSGTRTTLVPLPHTRRTRWAAHMLGG